MLGYGADESATLVFTDAGGVARAALGVDEVGAASFTLVEDVAAASAAPVVAALPDSADAATAPVPGAPPGVR